MNVLIAARISRGASKEEASRIERDDERAREWAEREGHTVVGVSADRNVSGAKNPFKRPALGEWLRHPERYDMIVASSIDRLGRNAYDLADLRRWVEANGKQLHIMSPDLTWPAPPRDFSSPIVWAVLAELAEIEREMIAGRIKDAKDVIRRNGGHFGGKAPWGFRIVGEKLRKTMEPTPELLPYLMGAIERATAGATFTAICEWLDEVDPSRKPWSPVSLRQILQNPCLRGKIVGNDGKVKLAFEPLLTAAQWAALQAAIERPRQRRRGETALLTGILHCAKCGGKMYRRRTTNRPHADGTPGTVSIAYRCNGPAREPSRCRNMLPVEDLEGVVEGWMTGTFVWGRTSTVATLPVVTVEVVPGDGHEEELAEIDAALSERPEPAEYARLWAERERIAGLPQEPSRTVERDTGDTVGKVFAGLDLEGRRQLLLEAGVKVYAGNWPDGELPFTVDVRIPEGGIKLAAERLRVLNV